MRPPAPGSEAWRTRYGPWAIVTGASSGIGEATARQVAALGLDTVLVARNAGRLRTIATELEARHGVRTLVIAADLSTQKGLEQVEIATASIDVGLFVAAAGFGTSGNLTNANLRTELEMLDVNCRAVLVHAHHFGRRFADRGRGGIVLLGSIVAHQGVPKAAHYAATKAYVQTLGEGLRLELDASGVDVLVSAPGPVHSGFGARAGMSISTAVKPDVVARGMIAALGRRGTQVPGALSKALTWSLAPLPRTVRSRIMGAIMGGMTRHRSSGRAD